MAKLPSLNDAEREKLIAYLDGELDEKSARAWEARLERDPQARSEAEALSRTWQLLDYLPRPAPTPTFASQTLERISILPRAPNRWHFNQRWRSWLCAAGWAASIVFACLLGYGAVGHWLPAPPMSVPMTQTTPGDIDQLLVRDLRVIENKRLYDYVDNMNFLHELAADPELFGDDN